MNWLALFIATTFFSGFLPGKIIGKSGAGGGFIGSVIGLTIQFATIILDGSTGAVFLAIFISFVLGIVTIDIAERFMVEKWGPMKRHTGEVAIHDFNQTNIDEVHGQLIAGLPAFIFPIGNSYIQVLVLIMSFVVFRFFDVLKPWPIKNIERYSNGCYGIMLDDTAAGLMAALLILAIMLSI